jgi:hypothetical protein
MSSWPSLSPSCPLMWENDRFSSAENAVAFGELTRMKTPSLIVSFLLVALAYARGGESMLTQTYQPLDGLGSGGIQIAPVICYDWNALSGMPTAIGLITAKNIPPNNSSKPVDDINLASASGLRFSVTEEGRKTVVIIDCTGLHSNTFNSSSEEQVLRATLECLRLVEGKRLDQMILRSVLKPVGQEVIGDMITEFINHPKDREFLKQP